MRRGLTNEFRCRIDMATLTEAQKDLLYASSRLYGESVGEQSSTVKALLALKLVFRRGTTLGTNMSTGLVQVRITDEGRKVLKELGLAPMDGRE
jgi:hypothetical protein